MNAPESFRAGDSVSWLESFPEYPASAGWTLSLKLLWPTGAPAVIASSPSGNDFLINLNSADTTAWAAGAATLVASVQKAGARVTLSQKQVAILPDLFAANAFDNRSRAVKGLADARAALDAYSAGGKAHIVEYNIAGRQIKFRDAEQIIELINYYEREVSKQNAALAVLQGQTPGRVVVRF